MSHNPGDVVELWGSKQMCGSQALTSALEATTAQDLGEGLGGVCAGVRWPGMSQNPSKGCGTVGDPSRC